MKILSDYFLIMRCGVDLMGDCAEWRSVKLYIGLFRNYWRFHLPIDEITSKGSSCSLLRQDQYLPIHTCPLVDGGVFYT